MPVYVVSRVLQGAERNYSIFKKLVFVFGVRMKAITLVFIVSPYFSTDEPTNQANSDTTGEVGVIDQMSYSIGGARYQL